MLILEEFLGDLRGFGNLLPADRENRERRQQKQEKEATGERHGRFPEERVKVGKL
jgi:hypothetical protein